MGIILRLQVVLGSEQQKGWEKFVMTMVIRTGDPILVTMEITGPFMMASP